MSRLTALMLEYRITMTPEYRDPTPDERKTRDQGATFWLCTFSRPGTTETLEARYSQGSAHRGSPVWKRVLACLLSDASSVDGGVTFEDWASDLGYDTDSIKALRTYEACREIHNDLYRFLPRGEYSAFMEAARDE